MHYDVVTFGGSTRDIVIRTAAGKLITTNHDPLANKLLGFEYGAKIPVLHTYDNFGGGACNVAVGLAKLGLRVACRVNLGRDLDGLKIKKNLKAAKVSGTLISWDRKERTDLSVVIIDEKGGGDHVVFVDKNASNNLNLGRKRFASKWIYISSLTGEWLKLLRDITDLAAKKKMKIYFNPGLAQLSSGYEGLREILRNVEILILTLDEAIELVLSKNKNFSLLAGNIARELFSWGPKIVVITEGARGASAYDGKELNFQEAIKASKVADTTGAGDAFSAAFLGAIALGKDIRTALLWGVKNGASVLKDYGAQSGLLTRKEIEK
ncbi:MAG: carbohydrate kinase family protein [Patescibacteria group bacterium]|nr:carbohydrate kinase family protein [Patescibacteria group bacterium]